MCCAIHACVLVVATGPTLWADMALPIPGLTKVPCEGEIEVPEDLNGFRIYLTTPRALALELKPGTNRLFDHGDSRDTTGLLVAVPARDLEFVDHGESLEDVLLNASSEFIRPADVLELRGHLHFLDMRSRVHARYRIDGVTSDGVIQMTTLHIDGGWTRYFCLATFGLLVLAVLAFVVCEIWGWSRHPVPGKAATPPVITLPPDQAGHPEN